MDEITFKFTATRADGDGHEISITVKVKDDGSPMADLADDAEEQAVKIAQKKLETSEVEVVSQ